MSTGRQCAIRLDSQILHGLVAGEVFGPGSSTSGRSSAPRFMSRICMMFILAAVFVGVLGLPASAQTPDTRRYVATPLTTFELVGDDAMSMPTAVTVDPSGMVYVVDGVNNRIVVFSPDGAVADQITTVGDQQLTVPISAKADRQGRLWIADSGHHRVLVRSADGTLERIIVLPVGIAGEAPDITDLALDPRGSLLWLADNDRHLLLRYDLATAATAAFGSIGESLGEFHYPFMLDIAPNGDVAVTDVVNGRAQILTTEGVPAVGVGTYGVQMGQLYRPKGLVWDADENIWISDSVLNVVQIFAGGGRPLDVLGEKNDQLLRFDLPMGLAFDTAGDLYVVELGANRVRKFSIEKRPVPSPIQTTRGASATVGQQSRTCTICHLEWIPPLVDNEPTQLLDVPDNPAEHPYVSQSKVCLSCHDGSVGDSRRRVWIEHGHRTGIKPPPSIKVPDHLPLDDGKIACRTCHSAHGSSEPRKTLEEIIFLRTGSDPSELCIQCHTDLTTGSMHGTHPLGKMDRPIPEELIKFGALTGKDKSVLSCLVCHEGHGSQDDLMLVTGAGRNELCLICHEKMRPGMFREHEISPHPLLPELTTVQLTAVRDVGAKTGPRGELICLSCHKMHHAQSKRYILAFGDVNSEICLRCHEDKNSVANTSHDLRVNFPDVTNIHGMTATEAGPCGSCHLFHNYARPIEPNSIDRSGQCTTCHQEHRCAAGKQLGPLNHPGINCVDCHDPHNPRYGDFLKTPTNELCISCHVGQAALLKGPHDVTSAVGGSAWPAAAAETHDACLACHRPHGTELTGLFRVPLDQDATGSEAACLACHADARPGSSGKIAFVHPRQMNGLVPVPGGDLPLEQLAGGGQQIACGTCHDPHRDPALAGHLLRGAGPEAAEEQCLTCHRQLASVHTIGAAKKRLLAAGFEAEGCRPCHVVHADSSTVEARFLWPRILRDFERSEPAESIADDYCVTCHRDGGPVAPPAIASHPPTLMFNPALPAQAGYLPLFDTRGEVDSHGTITCRTCHLPHGRSSPAELVSESPRINDRELRARMWHLRTYEAESVCTTCHGFDGLRRFMYFHDQKRRGGPLELPDSRRPPR